MTGHEGQCRGHDLMTSAFRLRSEEVVTHAPASGRVMSSTSSSSSYELV
jgi:hypothetical protein